MIRSAQFVQDAGPMAHSVRPESYSAIDNFYTVSLRPSQLLCCFCCYFCCCFYCWRSIAQLAQLTRRFVATPSPHVHVPLGDCLQQGRRGDPYDADPHRQGQIP